MHTQRKDERVKRRRIGENRERRSEKVRGEVVPHIDSPATNNLLRQDDLPKHLQPLKENYEISLVADEVQKQKRVRASQTIGVMVDAAIDVTLDVNEKAVEAVEALTAQPMRPIQRARATDAIDELTKIAFSALQDGVEEGAIRVNEIADSDPRAQQLADTSIEIDDLTIRERVTGKVKRKQ